MAAALVLGAAFTVDAGQDSHGLLRVALHYKVTRGLGYEQQQQTECACGECLAYEHLTPADVDHRSLDKLGCIGQSATDKSVDCIYYQLSENDGELVA